MGQLGGRGGTDRVEERSRAPARQMTLELYNPRRVAERCRLPHWAREAAT